MRTCFTNSRLNKGLPRSTIAPPMFVCELKMDLQLYWIMKTSDIVGQWEIGLRPVKFAISSYSYN